MFKTKPIDEAPPRSYHDFSCENEELDVYLHRYARNNHKKGVGKTFLLLENDIAVGFYTVSMASIEFKTFPTELQAGLPKYPIPVGRIGRLAVRKEKKNNGYGKLLLLDALARIVEASKLVAAYCVLVDAKDLNVAKFYERYGFQASEDNPLCLFLPLKSIKEFIF